MEFNRKSAARPTGNSRSAGSLSSSATIHLAEGRLRAGNFAGFQTFWGLTIVLGLAFLLGTGYEWFELLTRHKLTLSRNLFGSTFYTLVGFHGLHVTVGLVTMIVVLLLRRTPARRRMGEDVELVSWYWHFVDAVWVVVFTVVYVIGR